MLGGSLGILCISALLKSPHGGPQSLQCPRAGGAAAQSGPGRNGHPGGRRPSRHTGKLQHDQSKRNGAAQRSVTPRHAHHRSLAHWPQGAGKGKRVTVRSPEAAAQSGDALAVIGGGAQNTAEARVTSAQAPAEPEAIVKQEAGSGTAAGVRAGTH